MFISVILLVNFISDSVRRQYFWQITLLSCSISWAEKFHNSPSYGMSGSYRRPSLCEALNFNPLLEAGRRPHLLSCRDMKSQFFSLQGLYLPMISSWLPWQLHTCWGDLMSWLYIFFFLYQLFSFIS